MNVTQQINAGQWLEFTEVGDFFRLMEAPDRVTAIFYLAGKEVGRAMEVQEGYAEVFDKGGFDRVRVASGTTQIISFVTRQGSRVFYDTPPIGDVNVVSPVQIAAGQSLALVQATIDEMKLPVLPGANWKSTATVAANTPLTIFNAAANPNGAIIWNMEATDNGGNNAIVQAFIAKATAPTNVADGEVIAMNAPALLSASTDERYIRREQPTRIAGGLGLYFISNVGGAAARLRHCRYTLL